MSTNHSRDAYRMLQVSTKKHRMTVLRDEGLYRHIRFSEPGTSIWHFDLVTWPGHLVITGDLQDYHFARVPDMFTFFRTKQLGEINESYWSEKLVGHHQTYEGYSYETFKDSAVTHFMWQRDEIPEGRRREVWKAFREEVLEDPDVQYSQDAAYRAAAEFRYRDWDARTGYTDVFGGFWDVYEWGFKDYDYHFLVSLHAIVYGIHQWDTQPHRTEADWLREDLRIAKQELADLKRYHNYEVVRGRR